MFLESLTHDGSCFVTLTYSDDYLPSDGSVRPADAQLWLKRFRKRIAPERVRFYLVGEYGDESWRPHYHSCLFGVGPECAPIVESTWGMGHIRVDEFNQTTAQYVSGYVTKKMTRFDDDRLGGRHPEFARMSNRPGIGAAAMSVIAEDADRIRTESGDVPYYLMTGKKKIPLGRYLRRKLREELGISEDEIEAFKRAYILEKSSEMRKLREDTALLDPEAGSSIKRALAKKSEQAIRNLTARSKVYQHRKTL